MVPQHNNRLLQSFFPARINANIFLELQGHLCFFLKVHFVGFGKTKLQKPNMLPVKKKVSFF